jgi:hypothetical protein
VSAREVLKGKLKQAGLGRIADGVAELGRESFSLQTTKMPDENILIGASKLGCGQISPQASHGRL